MKKFRETGSVIDKPRFVSPCVSEESAAFVGENFMASSRKLLERALLESHCTVQKILRTRFNMKVHKIYLHQMWEKRSWTIRMNFVLFFLVCSDEAPLCISGKVTRYNCRIRGSDNSYETVEHERDYKVNGWYALGKDQLIDLLGR